MFNTIGKPLIYFAIGNSEVIAVNAKLGYEKWFAIQPF